MEIEEFFLFKALLSYARYAGGEKCRDCLIQALQLTHSKVCLFAFYFSSFHLISFTFATIFVGASILC
jgi:hypothetical protein